MMVRMSSMCQLQHGGKIGLAGIAAKIRQHISSSGLYCSDHPQALEHIILKVMKAYAAGSVILLL